MWFVLHTPCISNVTGHCGSSTVAVDKLTLKGGTEGSSLTPTFSVKRVLATGHRQNGGMPLEC